MKVLVVDDDRVLADVVTFTLRREGFQVVQAHDGQMALERWLEELALARKRSENAEAVRAG